MPARAKFLKMHRHHLQSNNNDTGKKLQSNLKSNSGSSGNSTLGKTTHLNLLNLPALVLTQVLTYLDLVDLKTFSQVSLSAKSWVGQTPHLRKFQVQVKDAERLAQIFDSNVPWNNLTFPVLKYSDNGSSKLLDRHAPFLKSVQIGSKHERLWTVELIQNFLCHLGPQLESLGLIGDYMVDEQCLIPEFIEKTCRGFKFPSLREFEFNLSSGLARKSSKELAEGVIKSAPNLTRIALPETFMWTNPASPFKENVLATHTRNLSQRAICPTKFHIDFCSGRSRAPGRFRISSAAGTTFAEHFDTTTLIQLSTACSSMNGKLFNVPILTLPTLEDARKLTAVELRALNSSVSSVLCRNVKDNLRNVYIPPDAPIWLENRLEKHDDYTEFAMPENANVVQISLISASPWPEVRGGHNVCRQALLKFRPSVTSLRIQKGLEFLFVGLCARFENLTTLSFVDLRGAHERIENFFEDLFRLFPGSVKELKLKRCDLPEKGFIDFRKPWRTLVTTTTLNHLTLLQILECSLYPMDPTSQEVLNWSQFFGPSAKMINNVEIRNNVTRRLPNTN